MTKSATARAAGQCLVSIDDNDMLVTVTVPAGFNPPQSLVRHWHDTAGRLGYGIKIGLGR